MARIAVGIVIVSALLAAACSAQTTSELRQIGNNYALCREGTTRSQGISDTSPAIAKTINALVPPGVKVNCTDKRLFQVNNQDVYFVLVAYGQLNDCLAGCFSSSLCAIVDESGAELYSSSWYGDRVKERPRSLPANCPQESYHTDSQCQPTGYTHPLTKTDTFQSFIKSAKQGNSAWRFCLY